MMMQQKAVLVQHLMRIEGERPNLVLVFARPERATFAVLVMWLETPYLDLIDSLAP